jgi:hypothetical protein
MSMFKKFASVSAVVAFVQSPSGQKLIGKAKEVVSDPKNRAKAAEFANKLRRPSQDRP